MTPDLRKVSLLDRQKPTKMRKNSIKLEGEYKANIDSGHLLSFAGRRLCDFAQRKLKMEEAKAKYPNARSLTLFLSACAILLRCLGHLCSFALAILNNFAKLRH